MSNKSVLDRQNENAPKLPKGANAQFSRWAFLTARIWQLLSNYLSKRGEPQVWQVRDRSGNICWKAYDPASGQSTVCHTENEVRIWLEQLNYQ